MRDRTLLPALIITAMALLASCGGTDEPQPLPPLCLDLKTGYDRPCLAVWLEPMAGERGSIVLLGDSLPIRALSDSGFSVTSWTLGGGALGHANVPSPRPMSHWVKALAIGNGTITAAAEGRTASTTISVVDSAAITSLGIFGTTSETIRAGSARISHLLRDAAGREIAAMPMWSASNNLVTIRPPQLYTAYDFFDPAVYLTLNAVGTVTITATFGTLTAKTTLVITP